MPVVLPSAFGSDVSLIDATATFTREDSLLDVEIRGSLGRRLAIVIE